MVDREMFMKRRIYFYHSRCPHCGIVLEFIERLNMNLPIEKRIKLIDCSRFHEFGIVTDPLIRIYQKYIDGYPTLFFEGFKITGVTSKEEIESWLNVKLMDEFLIPTIPETKQGEPIVYHANCEWIQKGAWGRFLGKLGLRRMKCNQ